MIDHSSADLKVICLIGFVSGKVANFWRDKTKQERQKAITEQYAFTFNLPELKNCTKYLEFDWSEEEFTRGTLQNLSLLSNFSHFAFCLAAAAAAGCYTGLLAPGVLTEFGKVMREPVGRVHFASTETAEAWGGYMDGACRSGKAEADVVLGLLAKEQK